jgi:cytochrome b561
MPFIPLDKGLGKAVMELHEVGGKVLIGLIILHILGALKHYLVDKDNVLQRMIPVLPRRAA